MSRTTPELADPSLNFRTTPVDDFVGGMPLIRSLLYHELELQHICTYSITPPTFMGMLKSETPCLRIQHTHDFGDRASPCRLAIPGNAYERKDYSLLKTVSFASFFASHVANTKCKIEHINFGCMELVQAEIWEILHQVLCRRHQTMGHSMDTVNTFPQ
ncbi:hypothetical protein AVEN_268050-1 [Araneus ventricosus]|uniref:Uncharacterized protein n=1 Tax=Araneus ventricosus TaxID=182803 RepID=A0A4Y2R8C8_ARAVE|nr:hypothetical protein AVEN_268050-1 [Araneus ventricosus]